MPIVRVAIKISSSHAIKKHSSSQAHSVSSKNIKSQPKISSFTVTKTQKSDILVKQGEIRLASFVAEHNLPFAIMEHLPKLMQAVVVIQKWQKK
ncbi:hypothetical protein evm_002932 [Chilo suppressalis]|nr:hypothetical protein evm_002932 [Chilo suppressalis]